MAGRALIVLAVVAIGAGAAPAAQKARPLDSEVKAVYLLNFGRLTTWPAASPIAGPDDFQLCVFGRDPFGSMLDSTVSGESVDGAPVIVKRIARSDDVSSCRMVFVGAAADAQLPQVLSAAARAQALTVSDLPQFVESGGMIQFVADGARVRFSVNAAAVDQAGLVLSSELLRVAAAVRPRGLR